MKKQNKNQSNIPNFFSGLMKHLVAIFIVLAIFSCLIYNYLNQGIIFSLINSNMQEVSSYIHGFGIFAPLIFVLLLIIEIVIAPISGMIFAMVGGALFGTLYGGTLLIAGNFIGSLICFWIARRFARKPIEILITKEKMQKFDEYSKKYGAFALFFLKVNPLTGSDMWNYVAGITKMTFRSFALAVFFASIPLAYIQAYFGHKLASWNPIFYTLILIATLIYFILFVLLVYYLVWKYRNRLERVKRKNKQEK